MGSPEPRKTQFSASTASVKRMQIILLLFIQPPEKRNSSGRSRIWAQSLHTDASIVATVLSVEMEQSWRPLASRRRPSRL